MNEQEIRDLLEQIEHEIRKHNAVVIEGDVEELSPLPTSLTRYTRSYLYPIPVEEPLAEEMEPDVPRAPGTVLVEKKFLAKTLFIALIAMLLTFLLTVTGVSSIFPLFLAHATVIIYPHQQTITKQLILTNADLTIRSLAPVQRAQAKTIQTTGQVTRPAIPAFGYLTIYNASPSSQTIPAGTQITTPHGTVLITNEAITVAGAIPPTEGSAQIAAHTLAIGVTANMPATSTLYTCCNAYIFVTNSSFAGGVDATTYHTPTLSDIAHAVTLVQPSLDTITRSHLVQELTPDEAFIAHSCSTATNSTTQPGAPAESIMVTVQETCTASAYSTSQLHLYGTQYLLHHAAQTLGSSYDVEGAIATTVTNISVTTTSVKMSVSLSGVFGYHITRNQEAYLKYLLAGKTKQQATIVVLRMQGIRDVQIESQDILPDTNRIDVQVQSFSSTSSQTSYFHEKTETRV